MKNKHTPILLVEDDPLDVANIERAFKGQGIENTLHVASTGKQALEMLLDDTFSSSVPKIILLDLNLPEMGGLELLQQIRQNENLKAASVFIMTTSQDEKDVLEAYNLNVAGYILKPVQYETFQETVATLTSFWNLIELPN